MISLVLLWSRLINIFHSRRSCSAYRQGPEAQMESRLFGRCGRSPGSVLFPAYGRGGSEIRVSCILIGMTRTTHQILPPEVHLLADNFRVLFTDPSSVSVSFHNCHNCLKLICILWVEFNTHVFWNWKPLQGAIEDDE